MVAASHTLLPAMPTQLSRSEASSPSWSAASQSRCTVKCWSNSAIAASYQGERMTMTGLLLTGVLRRSERRVRLLEEAQLRGGAAAAEGGVAVRETSEARSEENTAERQSLIRV